MSLDNGSLGFRDQVPSEVVNAGRGDSGCRFS